MCRHFGYSSETMSFVVRTENLSSPNVETFPRTQPALTHCMFKKILPLFLLAFCAFPVLQAQQWLGLSHGNYAGVNGVFLNPSSIADSRYGFHLNLLSGQTSLTNNYYSFDSPYPLPKLAIKDFKDPFGLRPEYYVETGGSQAKIFDLRFEARLPSFMLKLSPKHSIAFTNRMRVGFEAVNITPFLASDFRTNNLTLASLLSDGSLLRINSNAFRETGLAYAREIWSQDEHYLKGGLTIKYLQGIYSSSLYSDNLRTEITAANGQPVLRLLDADIGYHYTRPAGYPEQRAWTDAALWRNTVGRGAGMDIGFTYEYRPAADQYRYTMDGEELLENRKNKYKYRVGLSLLDVGGLRYTTDYTDSTAAGAYRVRRQKADIPQQQLTGASLKNYYPILNRGLDVQAADRQAGFRARLPTALHLNVDYKIRENLYVNAAWIQSLRSQNAIGMHHNSLVAITPRFETKHFEFSLPLTLINNYQQATFGAMMRVGSFFFIGSDNLPGLLNFGKPFGADIYAGITVAALKGRKKDKDRDGVSDKLDLCPNVAGVWVFKGCPDTDNDGVEDKLDKCPAEPGSKELAGCPDKDGDKIIDSQDKCPDEPGLAKNNGCPDSDEDGVMDGDDACPQAKGSAALKGCPDRDGDQIADKDDRCPDERGQARYNGCADNDGDNIPNPDDACPDQAGTPRFNGCPDRDGDAVPDKDDRCPDTYGSAQNGGCPANPGRTEVQLTQQEQAVLNEAFDDLEFETGKSVIKISSYQSMDGLAELLQSKPAYRLLVSGHTDNVGKPATNLALSKARANAVKKYLVRKGTAADQIITEGFGSRKPVADNKTPAGRQKNRRVEMRVIK